jgi:hypothetical protein
MSPWGTPLVAFACDTNDPSPGQSCPAWASDSGGIGVDPAHALGPRYPLMANLLIQTRSTFSSGLYRSTYP